MRKLFGKLGVAFIALVGINGLFAGAVEIAGEGAPEVIVAKVHADWCGSCRALEPVIDELKADLGNDKVLFVTFDVTSREATEQSRLLAAALGLESNLLKNNSTGKVLVIKDGKTEKVLTKRNDIAEMRAAISG